jgi:hypothetical protein
MISFDRISPDPPGRNWTMAAAVSSQVVSMPRTRMALLQSLFVGSPAAKIWHSPPAALIFNL